MKLLASFTIILIAICGAFTRASAQNVYRCGNSYSQAPCPDGVPVDVQDARTAEQKIQSDANIRRETSTADAMEKKRLKEEAQWERQQAKAAAAARKKKPAPVASQPVVEVEAKLHKAHGRLKKSRKKSEPESFSARGAVPKKPRHAASKPK